MKTANKNMISANIRPRTLGVVIRAAALGAALSFSGTLSADNPLVSHVYTADPAVRYYDGRFYVMASHDKDGATSYDLSDYYLFSSDDLINWQDHGIVFDARTHTTWATQAYAPDWIKRNGKYYLIFPNGASNIGILEASKPEGPYRDLIGRPLIDRQTPNANVEWLFDPGVFVDDDNTMYVYFGGGGPGNARVIKLSDDLRSTVGSAITIDAPRFFEAPYMFKRNNTYYFSYSTDGSGGLTIDYMTSNNPTTGFQHRGTVIPNPLNNVGNNNHASFVEVNGQWYAFYHNRAASGGSVYERSICADLAYFNSDGTMQRVQTTAGGVPKLKNFDPFRKVEAETIDRQSGIETERNSDGTMHVQFFNNSWLRVSNVDFQSGATSVEASVAAASATTLEIRVDSETGPLVGTLQIPATGGLTSFRTVNATISGAHGVKDLYFRARGRANVNWYEFIGAPRDCGNEGGYPICCDISADVDRDGWGTQGGQQCKVTEKTPGYAPLNPSDVVAAINVGGSSGDYYKNIYYQPDVYFSGGELHSTADTILDAGGSSIFSTERYGKNYSYEIPVPQGNYQVELHMVEMYHETQNGRVFSVEVEGQPVLTDVDLFAVAGHDIAYNLPAITTSVTDGSLSIILSASVDNGTLSGLLVRKQAASSSSSSSSSSASSSSTSSSSSSSSSSASSSSSSSGSSSGGQSGGGLNGLEILLLCLMGLFRPASSRRGRPASPGTWPRRRI